MRVNPDLSFAQQQDAVARNTLIWGLNAAGYKQHLTLSKHI
jgi:hypothetical protein